MPDIHVTNHRIAGACVDFDLILAAKGVLKLYLVDIVGVKDAAGIAQIVQRVDQHGDVQPHGAALRAIAAAGTGQGGL